MGFLSGFSSLCVFISSAILLRLNIHVSVTVVTASVHGPICAFFIQVD